MKNKIVINFFLSFIILTFVSCANDTDDSFKLLQKVIETTARGNTQTYVYVYNGSQIVSIDGTQERTDFTYTDGLISKMVKLNKTNQLLETIEYSYFKGKLVSVSSVGKYKIKYTHNADKTVSFEKLMLLSGNVEVKEYHGTILLSNGNLIKEERIYDNSPAGEESKYSISFDYDSKKNPLFNIAGFKELLNQNDKISINNNVISTVITSTSINGQITSSATTYKNAFTYDLENYPKERVSESTPLSSGFVGYLKVEYFY
ncbi:hypothetical protein IQ05_00326 [Flavobacterium tiangeerense]|uniref:YD repeat-containing protein n=1 Tax=Flavobacterium tiangeerense TaxID=459471 RepID=A0ABY3FNY3_9FLAO|nr:hypothetical protein [Flavobacterium tiangeerense]TWI03382.1 hypothetical protein IQ05_00326 [Flavobacterium tiangeerense]